jgi:hypothetical protein
LHVSGGDLNLDLDQAVRIGNELVLSRDVSAVTVGSNLVTPLILRAGYEYMRITNEGNVGIGTTAPTEKLEVVGNIKVGNATIRSGSGSPEGVVTGNVGDLFLRTDGSAGSALYVKESGSGTNTGWIAK